MIWFFLILYVLVVFSWTVYRRLNAVVMYGILILSIGALTIYRPSGVVVISIIATFMIYDMVFRPHVKEYLDSTDARR